MTSLPGLPGLPSLIAELARTDSDREAILFQDQSLTYGQLNDQVNRATAWLTDRGIRPGDRVGLIMANRPENIVFFLALLRAGAIEVAFSPDSSPETVAAALTETEAKAVLFDPAAGRLIKSIKDLLPSPAFILAPEPVDLPVAAPEDRGDPAAVGLIQYTSGSTGRPKGVALSQAAFLAASAWRAEQLDLTDQDRVFNAVRLAHSCGKSLLFDALSLGATLVLVAGLTPPPRFARALARSRPTIITGPPLLFRFLLKLKTRPEVMDPLRESVRYLEIGLDRAPIGLFAELRAAFPQATLINRYGQTELAGAAALQRYPPDRPLPEAIACGRSPFVHLADQSEGGLREIILSGPGLMQGYWPDLVQPTSHPSGDLVRQDDQGGRIIVGRTDDLFQSAGERVSPAEIEAVIAAMADVDEAIVVPIPDQALGARPAVCYYSAHGPAPEELKRRLTARLPAHLAPARCLALATPLPRNRTGKIDSIMIKKLIDEQIRD